MINRRRTRTVMVGGVPIGGSAPVVVQSMTKTDTRDVAGTVSQLERLAQAGCEIARCAIPDPAAAAAFAEIKRRSPLPLVADVHFDYRLALAAVEAGADKLRINPGNIGDVSRVREVARAAKERGVPIRVGVNAGSLEKDLLTKYGGPCEEALVESARRSCRLLEDEGFADIVISIKASDVITTIRAYERVSQETDYPLHVGLTEAGGPRTGTVKSAIAIGALLLEGIGDTIRVSLTADPEDEVRVARDILSSIGVRRFGVELVSCPTCGRCRGDLFGIVREVERAVSGIDAPLKVAVMGCEVNGPGEARDADIGVALGVSAALLFTHGRPAGRVPKEEIVPRLVREIREAARLNSGEAGGRG
ncbi:MAG: flavodoxin-dependent (E)-4-hydroxy-3-methylbut-2-enyl-diphosphate synthase [Firmicutes bacterium]|jgi:(E)-4-hydroxy-3-methylbut-2-enyl-diphosphate synthase|nr:flavodoxin-dependent (E)-4-hydroxy-3-methylbut-2-enyl-diphosphate synthase [Bacillota bacterium]MDH7494945.1 flavodoxin-dependent (E)-4-hydroxy-3-methylbut-2-enyl-diphosphate synthase [Bacillota bacterium]